MRAGNRPGRRLSGAIAVGVALLMVTTSCRSESTETVSATELDDIAIERLVGQLLNYEIDTVDARYVSDSGGSPATAVSDMRALVDEYDLAGFTLEGTGSAPPFYNNALFLDASLADVGNQTSLDGLAPRTFVAVNEEGGTVQIPGNYWFPTDNNVIGCTNLGPIPGYTNANPVSPEGFTCPNHSWDAYVHYLPFLRAAHSMPETWSLDETRTHSTDIGSALAMLNVNLELAPELGVSDGTYEASLLGPRTFSDDPETVADYARAFSQGIRQGSRDATGIVVKDFPGLGTVKVDTDTGVGVSAPLDELRRKDLVPYTKPIAQWYGAVGVMMNDAVVPGLTCPVGESTSECSLPASLSSAAYDLLRSDPYDWEGMVMTDTLDTPAVETAGRNVAEAARDAFVAGADMVLIKANPAGSATLDSYRETIESVRAEIIDWIEQDPQSRTERVKESVTRVIGAKEAFGSGKPD